MKQSRSHLAVVLTILGMCAGALAASSRSARPEESHAAQSLAGSWLVEVAIHNPPPGVPPKVLALRTYTADGSLIESGGSRLASGAHGSWTRVGNRRFRSAFTFFRFDTAGALVGLQHVSGATTLLRGGDRFEEAGSFVLVSPTGQELFRGTANGTGVRLGVD